MIETVTINNKSIQALTAPTLKNIPLWIKGVLILWLFTALFADQLANELPLSCKINETRHYPAFELTIAKLKGDASVRLKYLGLKDQMESAVYAPIPYSPQTIDRNNTGYISPFGSQQLTRWKYRHWMGTDRLGRDILAGMIHGSRVAFVIGFLAVFFAFIIGVPLGAAAGYYGDKSLKLPLIAILIVSVLLLKWIYLFYLKTLGAPIHSIALWGIPLLAIVIVHNLKHAGNTYKSRILNYLFRSCSIPLDLSLLRIIEIFRALPTLFILLALLAVFGRSGMMTIAAILALLMWPTFARYTRAEFLSLREKEFVSAARLFRKSDFRIIFTDILPNAKAPLIVITAFGVSAAILAESTLSFLGLGLAMDQVSWGSLLSEARKYFPAWWMAVFPGLAIFIIIYALNSLGDKMRNAR